MDFIKKHSYDIFKMLVNQIGIAIFGLVLSILRTQDNVFLLCVSCASVLFYMVLLYTMMWELGANDGIRDRARGTNSTVFLGAQISLVANIPNFILACLMLIGRIASSGNISSLYTIPRAIAGFWEAMYIGIVKVAVVNIPLWEPTVATLMYFFAIIPPVFASFFGYFMGYKDKKVFGFESTKKR